MENIQIKSAITAVNKEKNSVKIQVSSAQIDRHGDIVLQSGINIEEYKKNPVLIVDHEPLAENVVGRAIPESIKINEEGNLEAEYVFSEANPKGRVISGMVKEGILKTVSIGFNVQDFDVKENNGDAVRVFTKTTLMEVSVVAIPANTDAMVSMVGKSIDPKDFTEYMKTAPEEVQLAVEKQKVDGLKENTKTFNKMFKELCKTLNYVPTGELEQDTDGVLARIKMLCGELETRSVQETPDDNTEDLANYYKEYSYLLNNHK